MRVKFGTENFVTRKINSLNNELIAQRELDKKLTSELLRFKVKFFLIALLLHHESSLAPHPEVQIRLLEELVEGIHSRFNKRIKETMKDKLYDIYFLRNFMVPPTSP